MQVLTHTNNAATRKGDSTSVRTVSPHKRLELPKLLGGRTGGYAGGRTGGYAGGRASGRRGAGDLNNKAESKH